MSNENGAPRHHEVLIIGGGTAGLTVASQLCSAENPPDVAVLEPSQKHYYQPLWTLIGAGIFPKEESERSEGDFIPTNATWIQDGAATFAPDDNLVITTKGEKITYDYLVVAAGIQLDFDKIEGLNGSLGQNGICSNYRYDTVESTWENIRNFKGGTALFTFPSTPIKCAGAPQKIMYLAEEQFRKNGVRDQTNVIYACAGGAIFGVPKYRRALEKIVDERGIETRFELDLVAIDPDAKVATFADLGGGEAQKISYDMIHVTPPQSPPDFIKESPLAGTGGWVEVDKYTTQHTRYANVFSLGDCSSLPTSRTGAAVRKEAPVTSANLLALRDGKALTAKYDGYASCPLVTGVGKTILAEFGYDGKIMESFPFDQAQERYSMYALKAYGLPRMYWHGMLRGRA